VSVWLRDAYTARKRQRNGATERQCGHDYVNGYGNGYGLTETYCWKPGITVLPRYRLSTFGRLRGFSLAGPTSWNSLLDRLSDPTLSSDSFRGNYLKRRIIYELLSTCSAVEMLHDSLISKFTIDIDTDMRISRTTKKWGGKSPPLPSPVSGVYWGAPKRFRKRLGYSAWITTHLPTSGGMEG